MDPYSALCDQIESDIRRLNLLTSNMNAAPWSLCTERDRLEGAIEIKVAILQGLEDFDAWEDEQELPFD